MKKRLRRYAFHVGRWTWYASAGVLVLLALIFTLARIYLPTLAEKKPELEAYLNRMSPYPVRIESLATYWEGLYPGLRAHGVEVYAVNGEQPAIRLPEVRISLALLPLLWGNLEINSLTIVKPVLALERLEDGRFRISGFDPLGGEERAGDAKFIGWLFRQNKLAIVDGVVQWLDRRDSAMALHLSRVNLTLQNSRERHRLGFSAEFPPGMCRDCSLAIDIVGNPLASPEWDGEIFLRTTETNLAMLPRIVREKLPPELRGKFALQLWSEWDAGRPSSVTGKFGVSGLKVPVTDWDAPLAIRQANGDLKWRAKNAGWRLDLSDLSLGLSGPSWSVGHLRVLHQPSASTIQVEHANLNDITRFVGRIKDEIEDDMEAAAAGRAPNEFLAYWTTAKPGGAIDNFNLRIDGDWMAPKDFSLEADMAGVNALAYRKFPGVRGLHARLAMTRESGKASIDAFNLDLSLPYLFRDSLSAQRVNANLRWEKTADAWQVKGDDLRVISEDGSGTGKLNVRVPLDKSVSPHLKLRVDFKDGKGAHAARYYPIYHLKPKTLAWMESSFVSGEIVNGYLIYDGPIREFPFRERNGKFQLRGHVRNAVYRYLPGWEPIKQAEVDVAIDGPDVRVTGTGKIGDMPLARVVVQTEETADKTRVTRVNGNLTGAVDETLRVLHAASSEAQQTQQQTKWFTYLPTGLSGTGQGLLSLDLSIPIGDSAGMRMTGEYSFLNAGLHWADSVVGMHALEGKVRFTQTGILDGSLRGRFLGGDAKLTAVQEQEQLLIHAQGVVTAQGLAPVVGTKLAPRLGGDARWNVVWRRGEGIGDLRAEADLKNLKVTLPPPLDRPNGLTEEKLHIITESSTHDGYVLALSVGKQLSGKLAFVRADDNWRFTHGRIGFGDTAVTPTATRGLHLSARLDAVDLDRWLPWFGDSQQPPPEFLSRLSVDVKSLDMFDRQFGNLSFDFSNLPEGWSGAINGSNVVGKARFSGRGLLRRIGLDLSHLNLPDKQHERASAATDPRRLPALDIRSKSFQAHGKPLGELDFAAAPMQDGWKIERLSLTRPEMKARVSGAWRLLNGNHLSEFDIDFNSADMGKTMEAFGVPDQMAGGEVAVQSQLSWPGLPADPQLANLRGKLEVSAKKGRFLQVKPGAGRLFGLLDLSAINRYLVLDFSPLFGKGMLFDRIQGAVTIEKGSAFSQDLIITGPATVIDVGGRVGLAAEDFDLVLHLQPKLRDGLTLTSLGIWGPQVAAAVLAMQKIFKKQIAAGTRVTYVVKGPWAKPSITKTVKSNAAKIPSPTSAAGE